MFGFMCVYVAERRISGGRRGRHDNEPIPAHWLSVSALSIRPDHKPGGRDFLHIDPPVEGVLWDVMFMLTSGRKLLKDIWKEEFSFHSFLPVKFDGFITLWDFICIFQSFICLKQKSKCIYWLFFSLNDLWGETRCFGTGSCDWQVTCWHRLCVNVDSLRWQNEVRHRLHFLQAEKTDFDIFTASFQRLKSFLQIFESSHQGQWKRHLLAKIEV